MAEKVRRGPGRPIEFDRSKALDAAVEVFWELGYDDADMKTLSKRMGLSKPSIYNSFGPKEQLFLEALRRYGDTVSKLPEDALLNADSTKEGLQAFFATIARDVSGQHHPCGCLVACVAMPTSNRIPSVADELRRSLGLAGARLAAYFEAQVAKGMLSSTFEVSATVSLMQDLMFAMALRGRAGASLAELDESVERNVELVLAEGCRVSRGNS